MECIYVLHSIEYRNVQCFPEIVFKKLYAVSILKCNHVDWLGTHLF